MHLISLSLTFARAIQLSVASNSNFSLALSRLCEAPIDRARVCANSKSKLETAAVCQIIESPVHVRQMRMLTRARRNVSVDALGCGCVALGFARPSHFLCSHTTMHCMLPKMFAPALTSSLASCVCVCVCVRAERNSS